MSDNFAVNVCDTVHLKKSILNSQHLPGFEPSIIHLVAQRCATELSLNLLSLINDLMVELEIIASLCYSEARFCLCILISAMLCNVAGHCRQLEHLPGIEEGIGPTRVGQ
jgi:hypothetical protein